MSKVIYLDNASTTPVYKEVAEEMKKYLISEYGNPSSSHLMGEKAQKVIENTKKVIASEINARPWEIIFTSCATESNNLALQGLSKANPTKKKIIISSIEHSSIYELCKEMQNLGYKIVEIPVNKEGIIDFNSLEEEIDSDTLVVSIMHANNEVGSIQDIARIGSLCRQKNVLFHTDAVQSFCKEKIDVNSMKIDLLSGSGHKIGASKGIGFLYVREEIKIKPIMIGGGQEKGLRPGTQNVPAIAGFAKAVQITNKIDKSKIKAIRDYFISELNKIDGKLNGSIEKRVCNNINFSFKIGNAEDIVIALSEKGIMCSTKSACLNKEHKENRVLKALGISKKEIDSSIRFSINETTTKKGIDYVIKELKKLIK